MSPICYSPSNGNSLEDPVVITGARTDLEGTAAVFGWLLREYGGMNIDWRLRVKRGHHDGHRHIDIYEIQTKSGEDVTRFFDVTESFGKFSR
jgi:hypothetical protein